MTLTHKMINYKHIEKTELVVDNVTCDSCNKICDNNEFMSLSESWGYYSNKDLQTWTAQICEKCIDEKLDFINFKKEQTISIF